MSGGKIILIVFLALVVGAGAFMLMIPKIKRKKLAEGLFDFAHGKGSQVTLDEIKTGLNKLTNPEIDTFIEFAQGMQKETTQAGQVMVFVKSYKEMAPILIKSELMEKIFSA